MTDALEFVNNRYAAQVIGDVYIELRGVLTEKYEDFE